LGGPQSRSGRYGEVKIFYPIGTRTPAPPGRPARSQSLYRQLSRLLSSMIEYANTILSGMLTVGPGCQFSKPRNRYYPIKLLKYMYILSQCVSIVTCMIDYIRGLDW
jgi:hypothetical protein